MATGDLKNNLRKLIAELKQARFPQDDLDVRGLAHGDPSAFLPIVHYVFLDFSCALAQFFAEKDYELYGKNDLRFMEVVYRILRDEFGFKPPLTRGQFLSVGFAERKILLLSDILKFCRDKHKQLNPKRDKSDRKEQNQSGASKRKTKPGETSRKPDALTEKNSKKDASSHAEVLAGSAMLYQRQESSFENKENVEYHPRQAVSRQVAGSVEVGLQPRKPSELIIRTLSSQEGGKLKPVTYTTAAAAKRSSNIHTTKSVTWEDQVPAVWEVGGTGEHCWSPQEQRPAQTSLMTGEPTAQSSSAEGVVHNPHNPEGVVWPVPVPAPWTLAPCPSDELLLTPSGKAAAHQPIPLSASWGSPTLSRADVSMVDITQSVDVPHAQVMRHVPSAFNVKSFDHNTVSQSTPASSEELSLLRQQLQELHEKFDSVVLQNNEMSARVVVLESKVKMLEEFASQGNVCSNCRRPEGSVRASSPAVGVEVVSGFAMQRSSNPRDERYLESMDSDSHPTSCHSASRRLDMEKNNHSTEKADCLGEMATEQKSGESSARPKPNKIVIYTAASQNLEESGQQLVYPSTPPKIGKNSLEDSHVVLSPLETPDLSLAYLGSATKATVTNVHKRLRETREMLMRTNRDFAARFDHSQLE